MGGDGKGRVVGHDYEEGKQARGGANGRGEASNARSSGKKWEATAWEE